MNNNSVAHTTLVKALTVMLANILLVEDGATPVRDFNTAHTLLLTVFEGEKISLIKFIRSNTDMGLVEAKDFAEANLRMPRTTFSSSQVARMKDRHCASYGY